MSLQQLRSVIARNNWVVLDTETTGLDRSAEIVQIAVIDPRGQVLLDTLLRPTRPIPPEVTFIHGITDEQVMDAPSLAEAAIRERVLSALQGRDVVVYNAEYDLRLLYQSAWAHHLDLEWSQIASSWTCAMQAYAEFYGAWDRRRGNYRWHKLINACRQQGIPVAGAHSALADCRMTLALVYMLSAE